MITIRMTGGAIVGHGKNLGAIQRYSQRIGAKPEVTIRSDGLDGANCVCNWPETWASCEVHFNNYGLAWKWFRRNARSFS